MHMCFLSTSKQFKTIISMKNVPNKLRVAHFPQIPCKPFYVYVKDEEQAFLVMEALANQHLFLFENNMIPDYSNILLVQMWEDLVDNDSASLGDWVDYYNDEEAMEFDEFADTYLTTSAPL